MYKTCFTCMSDWSRDVLGTTCGKSSIIWCHSAKNSEYGYDRICQKAVIMKESSTQINACDVIDTSFAVMSKLIV